MTSVEGWLGLTPIQALRLLPVLVEQRARLRLELSELERQLGDVATALTVGGSDGQAIVSFACAAVDPDGLRAERAADAAETWPASGELVVTEPARLYRADVAIDPRPIDLDAYVSQPVGPAHLGLSPATLVHDWPVAQPEPEAAAADEPAAPTPEVVQPTSDGGAPAELAAAPSTPEPADEPGLLSCKRYGELCGVSEPVIYNAITKGWLHGDAVVAGPPKRIRVELADRQILERASAGLLRAGVARRCERTVVVESLAEDGPMSLPEAVRFLRRNDHHVLEAGDPAGPHEVDGVGMSGCALIEKATRIRDRRARLAAADRSAA